jgi:two-component system cell cycle sensor histidine kinase/response regulator CckA
VMLYMITNSQRLVSDSFGIAATPFPHSSPQTSGSPDVGESLITTERQAEQKILAINDTPDLLEAMRMLLQKSGYRVLTACNGNEGFEIAQGLQPDLIVSDVSMPEMDGITLCRRIRAHAELQRTPVLLVSAIRKDSDSVVEGLKAGADDYLEAPYNPMRLVTKVAQLIERKQAEEKIREGEERYRAVAETATDVIITIDESGKILFVNRSVERVFGYEVTEVIDKQVTVLLRDQKGVGLNVALNKYVKTGEKALNWEAVELVGLHKNGQEIPMELSLGEFVRNGRRFLTGIARDISERKRAEQELRKSEERYRDLVENARDIIYTHDLKGNYTSINKACEQLAGYTREEALKMNLMDTIAPEYRETARKMITRKLAGEIETIYDLEILTKQGDRVAFEVSTRLIYQNGAPVGVQGIARDVTERKQLEARLRQSQKLEAVGQLAGGVAHDFNNLLTVILGYSEIMLRRIDQSTPLRHNLLEIKKAAERASTLTRQLLAFSRKQVLKPKVIDLNTVVADMGKMLLRLIGEDVELVTDLKPSLARVKADPGQIEQVLLNLAVNARDAMPRGGTLIIKTENVLMDDELVRKYVSVNAGAHVMLTVSDTGHGMDAETQARVFEPFFTTKESGKGTGLGLATVYGIVKQSGGNIWLHSELGKGTIFKIFLPRVDDTAADQETIVQQEPVPRGKEKILVVEDEEQVLRIIREVLEGQGYTVLSASNGEEALELATDHGAEIRLLLTDVVMPQMSGRELAERLITMLPELKCLYMSGYTDDAIVRHGLQEDTLNFIQKPFDSVSVARKVREVLDSQPR